MTSGDHSTTHRARATRRALAGLLVGLASASLFWGYREYSRAQASLSGAIELASAGRLDEAASRVRAHLARDPGADAGHILLAQVLLRQADAAGRADGDRASLPRTALEHLDRVRPRDPAMAATLHLTRGNALDRLSRLDEAEAAWLQALDVDPTTPEAGWHVLNLYYLQWRESEARRLALRLFEVEPDAHDRVMLLLELLRHDARPPAAGSIVKLFEPAVRIQPRDLHAPLTLGLALTRAGRVEEGIAEIRRVIEHHPGRVEAWDQLLTCLDESGQLNVMEDELERLPPAIAASPRMLKHRARVAQGGRWRESVALYRQAQAAEPYNRVVEYRLSRALRHVGEVEEADRIETRLVRRDTAVQELRPLYDAATSAGDLQDRRHVPLYQKIAANRELMQFPDEARAWHRLILLLEPENLVSRATLERLETRGGSGS